MRRRQGPVTFEHLAFRPRIARVPLAAAYQTARSTNEKRNRRPSAAQRRWKRGRTDVGVAPSFLGTNRRVPDTGVGRDRAPIHPAEAGTAQLGMQSAGARGRDAHCREGRRWTAVLMLNGPTKDIEYRRPNERHADAKAAGEDNEHADSRRTIVRPQLCLANDVGRARDSRLVPVIVGRNHWLSWSCRGHK